MAAPGSIADTVSGSGASPEILSEERSTLGLTLYLNINLHIAETASETAVFTPEGFKYESSADVVLYLHGYRQPGAVTIADYLKQNYGKLREGLFASRRNLILAAPTLGPKGETQDLDESGGLDRFLEQCLSAIKARAGDALRDSDPRLGNLIIACHSAGGAHARAIAELTKARAYPNFRELWGFDCVYHNEDVGTWIRWTKERSINRAKFFYIDAEANHNQVLRCEQMNGAGIPNLTVAKTNAPEHMEVPMTHWRNCLDDAGFVEMRETVAGPQA